MKKTIFLFPLVLLSALFVSGCKDKYINDKDISLAYSDKVGQMYQTFEMGLSINVDKNINVYDQKEISATALIIDSKGNEYNVPMFYFEEYERHLEGQMEVLNKVGDGQFRFRYTPRVAGKHKVQMTIVQKGVIKKYPAKGFIDFDVKEGTKNAFLRVSEDKTHLEYSNGSPYVGIGHNLCGWEWAGTDNMSGTYEYDKWFNAIASQGGNMIQFDLCESDQIEWTKQTNELEWSDCYNGIIHYNQKACFKTDYKVSLADQLGLFYRLTLFHWEDFDVESNNFPDWGWDRNPYNSANSGSSYASDVSEFFTNENCKDAVKNFLRYVVARWGYSTNLMMYELFNEVDAPDMFWGKDKNYSTALTGITAWHKEMAAYLKELDVNKHMVSTSCASVNLGNEFWQLKDIDLTTIHNYTMYNDQSSVYQYETVRNITNFVSSRLSSTRKPVVFGEFALSPGGSVQRENDKDGVAFHNGIYAAIFAGSFGTTMHWTWGSYIDEYDLYYHYKGVSYLFDGADLRGFTNYNNLNTEQNEGVVWYSGLKSNSRSYLWIKDSMHDYNRIRYGYEAMTFNSGTIEVSNMNEGNYYLEFIDTYTGKLISSSTTTVSANKMLLVNYPSFTKDIAVKIVHESEYYQSIDMFSSSEMNSTYTIQNKSKITLYASGYSIGGLSDTCRFAYLETNGNFSFVARINKANYGGNGANAGIMLRDSLGGSSNMVFVGYTNYGTYETVYRLSAGSTANKVKFNETLNLGCYLKISKVDNEISTYISKDGINYQLMQKVECTFATSLIGVAASNINEYGYAKAIFDNISFSR